jgi:hypothetical protein
MLQALPVSYIVLVCLAAEKTGRGVITGFLVKRKEGEGWPVSLLRGSNFRSSIVGFTSSAVYMLFSLMFLFYVKKHRNVVVFA